MSDSLEEMNILPLHLGESSSSNDRFKETYIRINIDLYARFRGCQVL